MDEGQMETGKRGEKSEEGEASNYGYERGWLNREPQKRGGCVKSNAFNAVYCVSTSQSINEWLRVWLRVWHGKGAENVCVQREGKLTNE